ncbi:MAG: glycogen synthase GlgA [Verrucomicrobiota bacterium]|nr:glycogen synthase GlgA [Verrucomicrobiota bacterium]
MKILLASSEIHPYSKTGGLADMVGALAKFLARAGNQVGVVTPLYRDILEKFPGIKRSEWNIKLPLGSNFVAAEVFTLEAAPRLTIYFIHQPEFYFRIGLYEEQNISYPDNAERFIFFSKCVAHLARALPWQPELVHVHDWQVGLVPLFLQHQQSQEGQGSAPRSCLTVHNLAYQGQFPRRDYSLTNLPLDYFHPGGVEFFLGLNCLKAGIVFADKITTVSPRYAREITTELYGAGLDGVLRQRQNALVGILNGVDYDEWKTVGNSYLKFPYSLNDLSGKEKNKLALQSEMGLRVDKKIPLFGNISRLAEQKGVDIQLGALEEMLAADLQFVLLGSGATPYERAFQKLAQRYPEKVAVKIGFEQGLSHRIEAGCDFYLMPSRFEPCGLNQMYSLRYGTIPIVRATGGLDDSVIDISENSEKANGIKFQEYSVRAFAKSIRKALALYQNSALLQHFQQNAMRRDFSWEQTAVHYEKFYSQIGE